MLINIKSRHFHSSINHQDHLFHRTLYHKLLSSYKYCKVLKNSFFIEYLQKQSLANVLRKGVLKRFSNFTRKHLQDRRERGGGGGGAPAPSHHFLKQKMFFQVKSKSIKFSKNFYMSIICETSVYLFNKI